MMATLTRVFALSLTLAAAAACTSSSSGASSPDGGGGDGSSVQATGGRSGADAHGTGGASATGGADGADAHGTGGSTDGGALDGNTGALDAGPDQAAPLGPYPTGPYGIAVGDVFTNLSLSGYLNPTGVGLADTQPWLDAYSLQDLRGSGARYALVHVSAFNCPGCRHAAQDLSTLGKSVIDAGGAVLEILSDGPAGAVATRADLDAWVETYNVNVSSMIDAPGSPHAARKAVTVRETVLILELPSMKVAYMDHGDTTGKTPSSIAPAVTAILGLLGN